MSEYLETKIDKFIFKVAVDRFYSAAGVWAQANGAIVRIGLSDYIQQNSGDIAFVNVQPEGTVLKAGDEAAAIETIKVNISINSPIAGTIVRVNPLIESAPETINQDPYGDGWLCEIQPVNWPTDQENLLDPRAYFTRMKQAAESENQ